MDEILTLIDQIIEEHRQIIPKVQTLEQVANDLGAILALEEAEEDFLPGRLDTQGRGLQNLQGLLETIDQGLQAHFDREERGLLAAFERYGDKMFASALHVLLLEHEELKNRITKSRKEAAELAVGRFSREVWEGRAYGIGVYINHTCKLLEAHVQSEQELLRRLRKDLRA
ncbi:hypothetical protein ES703_82022 [subsurface metagenome]